MRRVVFILLFMSATEVTGYGQELASLTNDKFANRPFGKELTVKNLSEIINWRLDRTKKAIKNRYGTIDTLITFKSQHAELIFYRNFEKTFFYRATITGTGVTLANGVKIGMTKEEFAKSFGIKPFRGNHFSVKNITEYANHKFHFEKEKLVKIELDTGID